MLAILAPGQGAQTPGFLTPWLDVPGATDSLRWWSAVTGLDLLALGTTADADTIRDTAVAQPLFVAAGLVAAGALLDPAGTGEWSGAAVAAGHSVGELTASAVAGAFTPEVALVLVRERGREMALAAGREKTGMTAILGGDEEAVLARLGELGLTPANRNGAGQIVAGGRADALAALAADPPPGARLRPLSVAGAFHTDSMAPAQPRLSALTAGMPVQDPRLKLVSNLDGSLVSTGTDLITRLVTQIAAPVRWDLCMRTLGQLGVTGVVELPPAGTLAGLVKRGLPGVPTVALKTPDDLESARRLLGSTGEQGAAEPAPAWRVVVAPLAGTFRATTVRPGDRLSAGDSVGTVTARRKEEPVTAPYGGVVVEWLAEDGDPVGPGQPLVRLHPEAVPA